MSIDPAILEKVREVTADVLCVGLDEITGNSVFADFDGESLTFLELSFRLEREYGVRIRFGELNLQVGADGALTEESLKQVQQRWPLVNVERWRGRRFSSPLELLSVTDVAALVQSSLQEPTAKAG